MTDSARTGRRRTSLPRRIVFTLAVVLIVAAALEIAAFLAFSAYRGEWFSYRGIIAEQERLALREDQLPEETTPDSFINARIHPYLGYTQRDGYLDGLAAQRSAATARILVVGGSVAGHLYSKGSAALVDALREGGAFPGKEVEVRAHALGGYKQPQQLLTVTYLLALGARFDVVVNLDGFNEVVLPVTENFPAGVHPFYPRSWWEMGVTRDPPLQRRIGALSHLREVRRAWAAGFVDSPLRYSVSLQLLWKARDHWLSRSIYDRASELHAYQRDRVGHGVDELGELGFTADGVLDAAAEFWMRASLELDRLCSSHGIRYLHYLQPNQYAGGKPMSAAERQVAIVADHRYAAPARDGYPRLRVLGRALREAGVQFHDLTDLFTAEQRPIYIDACCHMNELGCALIAREVARDVIAGQ